MKKAMFAVLAAISFIASADAVAGRLPVRSPVILEGVSQGILPFGDPKTHSYVWVHNNGVVTGRTCFPVLLPTYPSKTATRCDDRQFPSFSQGEMSSIRDLIRVSLSTPVTGSGSPVVCTAIPTVSKTFRVKTSGRLLATGSYPCGNVLSNKSPEAIELVQTLENFLRELQNQPGS